MLSIDHLQFRYRAGQPDVFANFSLQSQAGNIVGLLGKNGTGKSTLLYLIAGLLRPQHGTVSFQGTPTQERRPEVLNQIFLVPEEFELPSLRLDQYVKINKPFYPRFSDEVLRKSLEDFELPLDLHLAKLSMGQRKKAFISFALATNTSLLLLDEPTNGLDIPSKSQFRRVISSQMNDERTIIVSTHQVHDIEAMIDRIVLLEGHRLLLDASIAELCQRFRFEQRPYGQDLSDALYAEPSISGTAVIAPNDGTADTQLNLELLFSALSQHPDLLQRQPNAQTSPLPSIHAK